MIAVLYFLVVSKTTSSYTSLSVSPLDRTMLVIPVINHIPTSFLAVCPPLTQAPQIIARKRYKLRVQRNMERFLVTVRGHGNQVPVRAS